MHYLISGYSTRFQKAVFAARRNNISRQLIVRAAILKSSKSFNIKQETIYHTLFEVNFQSSKVKVLEICLVVIV